MDEFPPILIFGGGFAGLTAAGSLVGAGRPVTVLEAGDVVGGLSRTERFGEFLFDLGGHRFHTRDSPVEALVTRLMSAELVEVNRRSTIFLRGKFFDYPLRPSNALSGLGFPMTVKILGDYAVERLRRPFRKKPPLSLEDWVVGRFGRTMFNIYFKEYSEKVWGIPCDRISEKWVAQRIRGLSLGAAVRNAFIKLNGREPPTLTSTFSYPKRGIGRIAERMREQVESGGEVRLSTKVTRIIREGRTVRRVAVSTPAGEGRLEADRVLSTIPLTSLARMMEPSAPSEVLEAADRLHFRDLLLVAVAVDRDSVTDQTWIYIPEKSIPFGRIHEPKNWSREMAPEGKTLLVVEYFCFSGDDLWKKDDGELSRITASGLEKLGFVTRREVIGTRVVRVKKAYPLFEVGFEKHAATIHSWFAGFDNLRVAGRSGMFQYYNMDHAIRSGLEAAEDILAKDTSLRRIS